MASTPLPRGSSDWPALTALRAIAALLVFLYHFAPEGLSYLPGLVAAQGHVGVTVFFVLSGFLITVRYYPDFAAGQPRFAAYFVRRAARILPLYYVVLILTQVLTWGSVRFDLAHWPEWTLTQALFVSSRDDITVTTSWSLTVEECFYAGAPVLFLAIAAMRRRAGTLAGTVVALCAATAAVFFAGSLIVRAVTGLGWGPLPFLTDEPLLRAQTIFGRIPDFALGAGAGLVFLSGRVESVWRRRDGAWIATIAVAAGSALLIAAQAGMTRDEADPTARWWWNLLVAFASALIVLALTCRRAPLSRLLSVRPAVYLGRISYALYLIQVGPLGNHLMYRIGPGHEGVPLLVLYLGMNVVAALLYEVVEDPARDAVMALWRNRSLGALPSTRRRRLQSVSLALVIAAIATQHVVWALESLPPVDEPRVLQVLGAESPDVLLDVPKASAAKEGRGLRVRLPKTWRRGPLGDLRAPRSLLVFVDGQPLPFVGTDLPATSERYAYYRNGRTNHLSLQVAAPERVTIVNLAPSVAAALAWSQIRDAPLAALAPLLLVVAAGAIAVSLNRRAEVWAPRVSLSLAVGLVMAWLVSGIHLQWWAPLVLVLELAGLTWLVVSVRVRGAARLADGPRGGAPGASAHPGRR